jgi:hypothetical protein
MDGNQKLTNSTLVRSLNAACASFANFIEAETGEITAKQIAALPDAVFNLAVYAEWLPEPPDDHEWPLQEDLDADHVWLGQFVVERTFREEFTALIQETLNELEPYNAEIGHRKWHEEAQSSMQAEELRLAAEEYHRRASEQPQKRRPTAKELIKRWQDEAGHSLEVLAEAADVSIATAARIKAGAFSYSTQRGRESLKSVASVIGCDWQDLVPGKRN